MELPPPPNNLVSICVWVGEGKNWSEVTKLKNRYEGLCDPTASLVYEKYSTNSRFIYFVGF
jgi:hypothetical protein